MPCFGKVICLSSSSRGCWVVIHCEHPSSPLSASLSSFVTTFSTNKGPPLHWMFDIMLQATTFLILQCNVLLKHGIDLEVRWMPSWSVNLIHEGDFVTIVLSFWNNQITIWPTFICLEVCMNNGLYWARNWVEFESKKIISYFLLF